MSRGSAYRDLVSGDQLRSPDGTASIPASRRPFVSPAVGLALAGARCPTETTPACKDKAPVRGQLRLGAFGAAASDFVRAYAAGTSICGVIIDGLPVAAVVAVIAVKVG